MKADKTLSIKVKSKSAGHTNEPEIEMISEWNLKRIVTALIIFLILIIIILAYFFSKLGNDEVDNNAITSKKEPTITKLDVSKVSKPEKIPTQKPVKDTIAKDSLVQEDIMVMIPAKENDAEIVTDTVVEKQAPDPLPETEKLNQHVTQARLAKWVEDNVPHGQVDLPLRVDDSKAAGFYYFTDVNNMRGKIVFHEWLRHGKSIYKRKFIIKGQRARMSTSKLFTYRTTGQWQVRLITDQGEVLHKIDFSVGNK